MIRFVFPLRMLCLGLCLTSASLGSFAAEWREALRQRIERIDKATPGQLGVYVKRLDTGEAFAHQADRPWYLASAAKVPIAIAVLQDAESGRFGLSRKVTLQEGDKVDGSGNVVWQKSGTSYTVDALLKRMLMESDNTAANMLIRTIGEDRLNQRVRSYLGTQGFNRITTFTQVRREVYGELHPDAHQLSNAELLRIASVPVGSRRVAAVARALSVESSQLQVQTMQEAYARYYARRLNTAFLSAYGGMLEQLVTGKLLSPQNLQRLYGDLKYETYDAYRLEAGLPRNARFIHKTGTQFERACHMGVINPQDGGRAAIIVAACAEDLNEHREARRVFEQIGRVINQTLLRKAITK